MLIPQARRLTTTTRIRGLRGLGWQAFGLVAAATAACGSINARPQAGPLPHALIDTLDISPHVLIDAAAEEVTERGMRIAVVSGEEGYLETRWYDPVARRPVGDTAAHVRRVVKLRFRADSVGLGQTQLASEAVRRKSVDPSIPASLLEMMVLPDHPGHELLRSMLDSLRTRFGG